MGDARFKRVIVIWTSETFIDIFQLLFWDQYKYGILLEQRSLVERVVMYFIVLAMNSSDLEVKNAGCQPLKCLDIKLNASAWVHGYYEIVLIL